MKLKEDSWNRSWIFKIGRLKATTGHVRAKIFGKKVNIWSLLKLCIFFIQNDAVGLNFSEKFISRSLKVIWGRKFQKRPERWNFDFSKLRHTLYQHGALGDLFFLKSYFRGHKRSTERSYDICWLLKIVF